MREARRARSAGAMIGTRTGLAAALVLSIAAVALGIVAFMATIRDEKEKPGRQVQTRITSTFDGDPIAFPLDEFFVSRDDGGQLHALYAYPPGFFGHMRGCKVIWAPEETLDGDGGSFGPGLFVDPCGGARFARDGQLLSGPADRGLDYFTLTPGVEGMIADTRKLYCGVAFAGLPAPRTPTAPASTTPVGSATPIVTATPPATATASATATATPSAKPARCDRVTPNSKQR